MRRCPGPCLCVLQHGLPLQGYGASCCASLPPGPLPRTLHQHTFQSLQSEKMPKPSSVIADAGQQRVVLSTPIAESSLTIQGVRCVVDSGFARAPHFDLRTGMDRLQLVRVSQASADQRRGRAGKGWLQFSGLATGQGCVSGCLRLGLPLRVLLLSPDQCRRQAGQSWLSGVVMLASASSSGHRQGCVRAQQGISALFSHCDLFWVCHESRMLEMNITT